MKYSPELAQANTILCLEIFMSKPKEYPSATRLVMASNSY